MHRVASKIDLLQWLGLLMACNHCNKYNTRTETVLGLDVKADEA